MKDYEQIISTLLVKIAELEKVVQQQASRIGELEKRLSKNSINSDVVEKRNYFWDHDHNLITPWPAGLEIMNTKFVKPTYETAQCLYGGKLSKIGKGIWMGKFDKPGDINLFPISESESFDIDYEDQFEVIEALYSKLLGV